jgi:uncharacterized repeat protein (TIGR02543 family)
LRDLKKKVLAAISFCLTACITLSCLFGCGGANNSNDNVSGGDSNGSSNEVVGGDSSNGGVDNGTTDGDVGDTTNKITVADTTFTGYEFNQVTATNSSVTFKSLSLDSEVMQKYGVSGEGCQVPITIASSKDGSLMLYGTDVASTYKSTDHGKTWTMANKGLHSVGNQMFAIDPINYNHVVNLSYGGYINLSFDGAETWETQYDVYTQINDSGVEVSKSTFNFNGHRYFWEGLAIDPTSYSTTLKYCTDIYLSLLNGRDTYSRTNANKVTGQYGVSNRTIGLYKSTDGGKTFAKISTDETDEKLSDGIVKICDDGRIFVGNQYGLFEINSSGEIINSYLTDSYKDGYKADGTLLYVKENSGITGLDVVGNTIFAQTWEGIYTIADGEVTKITTDTYRSTSWGQFLTVSQTNPDHMIYQYRQDVNNAYLNDTAVSFDGGKTWTTATCNNLATFTGSSWISREKVFIIDPSDDNRVITFGEDTLVFSDDGGKTFLGCSGISNICVGGRFNVNYYDSNLMMFAAQDYTGAISYDGGKTWRKLSVKDKNGNSLYGIHLYCGFASDKNTLWGWNSEAWKSGYYLVVSHDGGYTWEDTGILGVSPNGSQAGLNPFQSFNNPNTIFAGAYISHDNGYTWNKMDGCTTVYTANYSGKHELYGTNENGNLVVSYDDGDSWEKLTDGNLCTAKDINSNSINIQSEYIMDLAYDFVGGYIYILDNVNYITKSGSSVSYNFLYKMDLSDKSYKTLSPLRDTSGYTTFSSIAIDPNSTNVLYVSGGGSYFLSATGIQRSIDGGESWQNLTYSNNDNFPTVATNAGGYEAGCVRVVPTTGEVIIACGCYGIEKFNPPYDNAKLTNVTPTHTIKYVYDGEVVNTATIINNNVHNYVYTKSELSFVSWFKDQALTQEFANGEKVYCSLVLYAKMAESQKVNFFVGDEIVKTIDIQDWSVMYKVVPQPEREGYIFAGWYTDKTLTEQANIKDLTNDTNVYAGFYLATENILEVDRMDDGVAINYSSGKIGNHNWITNDEDASDRSIVIPVDKNSTYFVTFTMDTRFRFALTSSSQFWIQNKVPYLEIDEDDNNDTTSANKQIYKTFETGNNRMLMIHYWSATSDKDFLEVKSTIKIYKLADTTLYL